jgi:hypothetical protein
MAERRAGFDGLESVDPRAMLAGIRTRLAEPERPALISRLSDWARRLLGPAAALAVAAVALLVVTHRPVEPPRTRLKGSLALHVFRLVDGRSMEASSGDSFSPGDRIRFVIDLPTEGQVAVFGVEASGALYKAWPLTAGLPTRFAAGMGLELPGAVSLDAKPGRETLYLVQCPPEAGSPSCTSAGPGARPMCSEGCLSTPFVLDKQP